MRPGRRAEEVAEEIEAMITGGEWTVLPTRVELQAFFKAGTHTVGRALMLLRDDGVVMKNNARKGPPRWVIAGPEVPRYKGFGLVIADRIAEGIASGRWSKLPTVDEFAEEYQCANETVIMALHELTRRGLVGKDLTARGVGRWVLVAPGRPLPTSRAETVAAQIRDRINFGEWPELPKVRELRRMLTAHANVVQEALALLAADGLLVKSRRQGARWEITPAARCRRSGCPARPIGRGLCSAHYGRWQAGADLLDLPGDAAPAAESRQWSPPGPR